MSDDGAASPGTTTTSAGVPAEADLPKELTELIYSAAKSARASIGANTPKTKPMLLPKSMDTVLLDEVLLADRDDEIEQARSEAKDVPGNPPSIIRFRMQRMDSLGAVGSVWVRVEDLTPDEALSLRENGKMLDSDLELFIKARRARARSPKRVSLF